MYIELNENTIPWVQVYVLHNVAQTLGHHYCHVELL